MLWMPKVEDAPRSAQKVRTVYLYTSYHNTKLRLEPDFILEKKKKKTLLKTLRLV